MFTARETRAIAEGIDQEAGTALAQSLAVGGVCIVYRLVLVYYEMKAQGLGLRGYLKSLVQLGAGAAAAGDHGEHGERLEAAGKPGGGAGAIVGGGAEEQHVDQRINGLPPVDAWGIGGGGGDALRWLAVALKSNTCSLPVQWGIDHFMSQWNTVKDLRLPENLEEAAIRRATRRSRPSMVYHHSNGLQGG